MASTAQPPLQLPDEPTAGLAGVVVVSFAVICSVRGPALIVALASINVASLFEIGAGVLAAAAAISLIIMVRRRRASHGDDTTDEGVDRGMRSRSALR